MAKPFANLIKKLNDEYLKNRKKIPAVKGLAEKFPCQLCDATGALMMKIQFCKVNTPSNVFLNSKQKTPTRFRIGVLVYLFGENYSTTNLYTAVSPFKVTFTK